VAMLQVARAADEFVLREHLGRGWTNEMVTFPLSAAQAGQFKATALHWSQWGDRGWAGV